MTTLETSKKVNEIITIELDSLKSIRGDINKKISTYLKSQNLNVLAAYALVICQAEPGRCWVKYPGKSSCTAYS